MTRYHVLRVSNDTFDVTAIETWSLVATEVEAHTATDAVRRTAKEDGVYVAVPSRSFTPIPVKLETTTVVKVGA